MKFKYC